MDPDETPAQRRQRLLARSAELRLQLVQQSRVIERPLVWADRAQALWQWAQTRRGPLLAGGVALTAVLLLRRPRRAVGLAAKLWSLWRLARRAAPLLQLAARLQQRPPPP